VRRIEGRLFDEVKTRIISQVRALGKSSLGFSTHLKNNQGSLFDRAKKLAHYDGNIEETDKYPILIELNRYLSTKSQLGSSLTAGTVFIDDAESSDWWVCVTPACDLARPKKNTPFRPFLALKLKPLSSNNDIKKALNDATSGKYVFVKDKCFKAISSQGAVRETMYVKGIGQFLNGKFDVHRIVRPTNDNGSLTMKPCKMIPKACLRAEYASHLLQYAAQQQARIGLDFVKKI